MFAMEVWTRLRPDLIFLDLFLPDKDSVLRFAGEIFAREGIVRDAAEIYNGLRVREETMTTGIGEGIGIPHTMISEASKAALLLIRLGEPIDFQALDAVPVDIILVAVAPENQTTLHLQLLAGISRFFKNTDILKALREASDAGELLERIKDLEREMSLY
jgi:PTS system nitrogen regulatory IIA component